MGPQQERRLIMKKILLVVILLLLANCHSVFADELWLEDAVGLPKTYMESEL